MEPNIKKIWGIAKSPELKLTDEELHLVVQAHTGKDSIKALNKRELQTVIRVLGSMKDSAKKSERGRSRFSGNTATENQRKKIFKLTQELGMGQALKGQRYVPEDVRGRSCGMVRLSTML